MAYKPIISENDAAFQRLARSVVSGRTDILDRLCRPVLPGIGGSDSIPVVDAVFSERRSHGWIRYYRTISVDLYQRLLRLSKA